MQTRSSRYVDSAESTRPKLTRSNKNKYLYDEVNKNIGYEEIDNFSGYENFEFEGINSKRTKSEYDDDNKDFENSNLIEEKVYDINSVLEEAKKNRVISDEIEKKRKLQNVEYNILSDLNKKYINRKEKIEEDLEKEGIRELIDTITSRTLAKDIEELQEDDGKDLMSDLMATSTLTSINNINLEEEIAKEILVEKNDNHEDDEIVEEDGKLVNSFYTKSMDLTEQDFDFKEEIVEETKQKRKILILVVLIILVLIAIVGIFILKKINII